MWTFEPGNYENVKPKTKPHRIRSIPTNSTTAFPMKVNQSSPPRSSYQGHPFYTADLCFSKFFHFLSRITPHRHEGNHFRTSFHCTHVCKKERAQRHCAYFILTRVFGEVHKRVSCSSFWYFTLCSISWRKWKLHGDDRWSLLSTDLIDVLNFSFMEQDHWLAFLAA